MREGFPEEDADGGKGALCAGAVLDVVLVVVFIVVHDLELSVQLASRNTIHVTLYNRRFNIY